MSRATLLLLLFTAALGTPLLPAAETPSPATRSTKFADLFGDDTLARGKGVEVKRSQLDDAYVAYKSNMASRNQNLPEEQRTVREAQLLDRLVVTQLLLARVTDADRARAHDLFEKFLAESKKSALNEDVFLRQLHAMGMTMEKFKARVMEQALAEAVIEREIKLSIVISDTAVTNFYNTGDDLLVKTIEEDLASLRKDPKTKPGDITELQQRLEAVRKSNLARMEVAEKVRVSHVFISTRDRKTEVELPAEQRQLKRALADKARARAVAGEDFAKLVLELSEDPALPQTRGEYTFTRNDSLTTEFKAAAFSLRAGGLSEVVTTQFGYHVIKCLDKVPAKKNDLATLAPDLKEFLIQQELQKALPAFFQKLKTAAAVEILEAKYRIELKDTDPRKAP